MIEFLGGQTEPTDREALLLEHSLVLPSDRWHAYRAIRGSPGWFQRFGGTFIPQSMSDDDEAADHMIDVLSCAWEFAPDQVTQLLQEHWAPHRRHDERSWRVLENARHWSDDSLTLACTIIRHTEIAPMIIDHTVATIGVEQPNAALSFVRARLDHELADAQAKAEALATEGVPQFESDDARLVWQFRKDPRNPIEDLMKKDSTWESLPALARQAPTEFLKILWPWFEQYFDALATRIAEHQERLGYPLSYDVDYRFEEEDDTDMQASALLDGLRTAAESLARTDARTWSTWVATLGSVEIAPVQRLIAHSFANEPEQYAKPALEFLLDDPRRYVLGSTRSLTSTSSRLVKAASNHWSDQEIERFETAIKSYKPAVPSDLTEAPERFDWNRTVRRIRLSLLRALPKNRLTAKTRHVVEEEERVFPDDRQGSRSTGVQTIGSIMDAAAIGRASDKDVINAFRTLPDSTGWNHPREFMQGGNVQLSREFANFAKVDPRRAIRLLGLMEPETGTRAAGYALVAMSESAAADQVLKLFHDVVQREFDSDEFRISASQAIQRLVSRECLIDDDTVAVLEHWLASSQLDDANPDTDIETEKQTANSELEDPGSSVQHSLIWGLGGSSIVPGGSYPVVEALVHIRLRRSEHNQADAVLRTYLDRCKNRKEWSHLLPLVAILHPDNTARRAKFLELLFTDVPGLVGDLTAARLLANAHWWSSEFANSQFDRWQDSGSRLARQAYGEMVAIAFLMQPTLTWPQRRLSALLETHALEDTRTGATLTAAHLWSDADRRANANELLTKLLSGGGAGVWVATFEVFRLCGELLPDSVTDSLLSMIADRLEEAPRVEATFLVKRMASLLPHKAVLVGRVAKQLIAAWRTELGDIRRGFAMEAEPLVDLAVTLHRLGPETRETGTELFEQLIDINLFEAHKLLDEIDNRFLDRPPTRRRRLPRRSRASVS